MNKACEAATVKKTKSLGSCQQTLKAHNTEHKRVTMPSKDIILHNQVKSVEVTVKTKGQKRTSPVASFSPGQKAEKKRSTTNNNKSPQNWGNVFRQQNLLHMTKEQTSTKHSEDRESKKNINAKTQQKSTVKHPMRSEEKHLETCCLTTLVRDSSVQCTPYNPEIYNPNNVVESNSAHMFNHLHMLGLIKRLQDLVNKKDKKTCETIVTEMEQILQKISDLTKVESSAVSLKESSKKMKAMYDSVIVERDKLQREILKKNEKLEEIEFKVKVLTLQLDTATREKNDMISVAIDLRRQTENNERIIKDLEMDLNKQTELAQNYIDSKFEIDKLAALSSYKDTLITGYRSTITELQNQITSQLKILNEICMKEGSSSPQMSVIHTGHACSSPTSTDDSNRSLHDLSDVSTVNPVPEVHARRKDALVGDSELVSLLDGESSHTLLSDRNEVKNDKRSAMRNNNENNTVPYQNVDTNNVKKSLRHSCNKENDIYKTRKFKKPTEKQNDKEQFRKLFLNASKALESIRCAKSTVSGIRKQDDMQNRKPVNIPSPLRDCPHPDWSDSSLPSISTVSNLDVVPSNDI